MNTVAMGNKIMDIAGSIAGSLKPKTGELSSNIAEMVRQSSKYQSEIAQDVLRKNMEKLNIDVTGDEISSVLSKVKGKDFTEAIDGAAKDLSSITDRSEGLIKFSKIKAEDTVKNATQKELLETMGTAQKYTNYPLAYFNSPDKKINNTRIQLTTGAFAAATVGGRYLSGGTLTTDSYGKKDIAGLPFL